MGVLLIRYNKVTNVALNNLTNNLVDSKWADLNDFGDNLNLLGYSDTGGWLEKFLPFDRVMVGDIFWPTGQNICRWCKENSIPCCFLQHGQWIYVDNKQNPQYVPSYTCVYGGNVHEMMKSWPYSQRSQVEITGNPRYDNVPTAESEGFV